HPGGGLDRDASGVERYALTDKGERRARLAAAVGAAPFHHHEARWPRAALRYAEQRIHAEFSHPLLVEYLDGQPDIGERLGLRRKRFRIDHVGRFRDEISGKKNGVCRPAERLIGTLRR